MKTQNNIVKGIALALTASIISGLAIFYSKLSVAKIDPLVLTTSRNLYVGILFLITTAVFTSFKSLKVLTKKNLVLLILVALIGGGIPFYLFFTGLTKIGAQNANIIHKSLFIWVAILSVIFLKEKVKPEYLIGYFLIFIGTYSFFPVRFRLEQGELLIFLATLLWSVENIFAKKVLNDVDSKTLGLFRMLGGGLILFGITLATGKTKALFSLNPQQLSTVVIGGSILFLYVYFWYRALKSAPASLVTLVLSFSVVVGNLLNGAFAGLKLTHNDFLSTLLIGFAVFFVIFQLLRTPVVEGRSV